MRLFGIRLKGDAAMDWDEPEARRIFSAEMVADADRLLALAPQALTAYEPA